MATVESKAINKPDEVRSVGKGSMAVVNMQGGAVGLGTFEPGWQWSKDVKPIAGTESCQAAHFGYVLSGRMAGRHDDGTEFEVGPGDIIYLSPGHDAWIVGDEPCRLLDWGGAANYAKPA